MAQYRWKEGAHHPRGLSAQVIGNHLEELRTARGGHLTRETVLEDARRRTAPTHEYFEWDDTAAANSYRLVQAGDLLRHVVVVMTNEDEGDYLTRAFVVIKEGTDRVYTSNEVVMASEELRSQVLVRALRECKTLQAKYGDLEELVPIFRAINRVMAKVLEEVS